MSICILTLQKKFIQTQLKKGNKNYEEIYQMAIEKQIEEEIKNREEYVRIQDVTRKVMTNAAKKYRKEYHQFHKQNKRRELRRKKVEEKN